jgi:hypothetical protein
MSNLRSTEIASIASLSIGPCSSTRTPAETAHAYFARTIP